MVKKQNGNEPSPRNLLHKICKVKKTNKQKKKKNEKEVGCSGGDGRPQYKRSAQQKES